ncbi:unnamed protein product [Linum trigynum]|uniref:Uncharacterized protein n=1 Tax=Linum trigynum TaxID=586398 RepID=A0AAV2G4U2_9ROSI
MQKSQERRILWELEAIDGQIGKTNDIPFPDWIKLVTAVGEQYSSSLKFATTSQVGRSPRAIQFPSCQSAPISGSNSRNHIRQKKKRKVEGCCWTPFPDTSREARR